MQLINLQITRIIIHQVFERDSAGQIVAPLQSHEFIKFTPAAQQTFVNRVNAALGENSKAVQMQIHNQDKTGLPKIVDTTIDQDDSTFATSTYDLAIKLSAAQHRKGIPGGIVAVFSGTYGYPMRRIFGVIKAEIHSGYEITEDALTKEKALKYVEELILTPNTRVYKTAGFFEKVGYDPATDDLNEKWAVFVSDHQIGAGDKPAAQYFYADFLGFGLQETSARTTKEFYMETKKFISAMAIPAAEKVDLMNALTTYLKVNISATASTSEFSDSYFAASETKDAYKNYMESVGLPSTAFTKDLEHIAKQLQTRKVTFSSNVKVTAPSDKFEELVSFSAIDGEPDKNGQIPLWTLITVKDRIVSQE